MRDMKDAVLCDLNRENMLETIQYFSTLYRYSGTSDGEKAVRYLEDKLSSWGVSYEHCQYDGFFSIPLSASLTAFGNTYDLIADVYSREADGLTGDLIYDRRSCDASVTGLEDEERFASFRDKIVLTWEGKGMFAYKAYMAGARGIVHICKTKGPYVHHSNIGVIWGTPGTDQDAYMQFLPSAGISRRDGEELISLLERDPGVASLSIRMDTGLRPSSMVVAEIPGRSDNYVLVSGHYDSWYEGITDNAVSNAIMLEYARVLKARGEGLERGVKLAWWSGHSDGRFSGSAWYCDSHWEDLNRRCVAHINLDLTGCKNSDQIVARTACTEGLDFTGRLIEKYTGRRPDSYIPMIRGADQSFWGVSVPITIMLKYEPTKENRLSDCPSGGPWWHTNQDTMDKLDETIMMRDARINMELIMDIQSAASLPVSIPEFLRDMDKRLSSILNSLDPGFDAGRIPELWQALTERLAWFASRLSDGEASDADVKATIGKLLHVIYCRKDPYQHDYGNLSGPFYSIGQMRGVNRMNTSGYYYTMAKTDFLRYRNRLCGGMAEIISYIDGMKDRN